MTEHKKKQADDERQIPPAGPRQKKTMRVVGGEAVDPTQRRPPMPVRVVYPDEERLTPKERKQRFASNLDRLVGIVGLNRKNAAHEVGIPYKLVRRLVSAGISRTDERNIESLTRIADYFALPGVDHLWHSGLLRRLLTSDDGSKFIEKFRSRLLEVWESRFAGLRVIPHEEAVLLGKALGVEDAALAPTTDTHLEKVVAILTSAKADTFKRVIDDYYELVGRPAADSVGRRGTGTSG